MTRRQKATLVLSSAGRGILDCSVISQEFRVIETWNLNLLKESLHLALDHLDVEVVRVIFDQSVDAEVWLEFLSSLPPAMRGDVLCILERDNAFLSSVSRGDGRVIYRLGEIDLKFYMDMVGLRVRDLIQLEVADELQWAM